MIVIVSVLCVCVIAAGFALFGISCYKVGSNYNNAKARLKWSISRIITLLFGIAGVLMIFCLPGSIHTVDAGEIAVVKELGTIKATRTSGTYFDFWITNKYEMYDAKVQTLDITNSAYSKDAQTMDISMTVQYQIRTDKASEIATNYGSLTVLADRIESVSVERTKAVLSGFSAMEIIEKRSEMSPKVEENIKNAISENYHVTINTVVLKNIDFSDAFEKTVEDKMIAEQEKLKAEYENEQKKAAAEAEAAIRETEAKAAAEVARIKAEADLIVAKTKAEAKLEAAKGDANAQREIATAEAFATQKKLAELARSMNYTVTEVYDDPTSETKVVIGFEIEWGSATIEDKQLLLDYLKYYEYLNTWNGELPDVVTDGSGIIIELPNTTNKG